MTSPIKIFIFGSCVSRDFVEISAAKNFKLVDYYARSSFASISAKPLKDRQLISRIESKWQRSMVARDLEKNVFHDLLKNNYDMVLIDLIDERFNLAKVDGSLCTVSTEYKKYQDKKYKAIPFDSEEKFEHWKLGFEKFIKTLESVNAVDKVRINKVWWAGRIDGGGCFTDELSSYIKRNNEMLDKMYAYISEFINVNQFIDYPSDVLVAANVHKWGVQPFHYIDSFYHYTKKSLEVTSLKKIEIPINKNAGKVFSDLFSAYKSLKEGEFFINRDGVMYPFKWDMSAGIDCPVVFFTPGRTIRGKPVPIFQRSKYFDSLEGYNCVSCFDPTLFKNSEINLAWFQGEKKRFYALELAKLWKDFVSKVRINTSKILYYGSSGGGILGMHLAKSTPNCILFMSNVQTDVRDYDPRALKKLVKVAFDDDMSYVEKASKNQNRFSINGHSGPFNLVYSQNKADNFHYERHYKRWRRETDLSFFKSVKFIEYDDPGTGHGPLDAKSEIEIIRGILEKKQYDSVFPKGKVETISASKKSSNENQYINFKHSAFPTCRISLPIDWSQDPYQSKNWKHHLNSLRWLRSLDQKLKESLIIDFYEYHFIKKRKNPYFNTRRGDHTIAIRVGVLIDLIDELKDSDEVTKILVTIVRNDVDSLLKDEVYQENNHGLMADMAIIKALSSRIEFLPSLSDAVHARLIKTLSKMYDEKGVCLEHSISYQEYNLAVLIDIKNILSKEDALQAYIDTILQKSKELLGFHLLSNNQYIPIGDSFRLPNVNILKKVYGSVNSVSSLASLSNDNRVFFSESGYFVYRDANNLTHLSLVSAWHSHVHKQNDELSVFLYYKGHIVFDDPGYTDCKKWSEIIELKSEQWHSNFWVEDYEWSDIRQQPNGSEIKLVSEDPVCVVAKSSRQNGFELCRNLKINSEHIFITDSVSGKIDAPFVARHQFLLYDVVPVIENELVFLNSKYDNLKIAKIEAIGVGAWCIEKGNRVAEDRRDIHLGNLLVFRSSNFSVSFKVFLL